MLNNKIILITGGTGSFGKHLTERILKKHKPKKIIIFSRDELKQYEMEKKFHGFENFDCLRFFIGDVRDLPRLNRAMQEVDIVFHAAALKHVPAAEYNPFEAVKTNIIGAQNIIDACINSPVKKVIALSTDKAAAPGNLYGATKLVSDKLFIAANNFVGNVDKKFSVVRYGNVLGSRGSVVPFFLSLQNNETYPITDKHMTRFNISLDEGVNFVLDCLKKMWGGEIFVPRIPSYRILDVVKAINKDAKIKYVGIRPGEKIHEEMITKTDGLRTIMFKNYYVILPSFQTRWKIDDFIKDSGSQPGVYVTDDFSYNSGENEKFLTVNELKLLIKSLQNG